jgi:hypothetical protein
VPSSHAICDAIRRRRLVSFDYHGLPRVIAPYCHGWSSGGKEVLRAVQVGGESASGGFGFGKLWHVSRMTDITTLGEAFEPDDPNYEPEDVAMARIHCRVWVPRIVRSGTSSR